MFSLFDILNHFNGTQFDIKYMHISYAFWGEMTNKNKEK